MITDKSLAYNIRFKEQCYSALRHHGLLLTLMNALDNSNHTVVRYCLEEAMDDPELYEKDLVTDEGELIVLKAKMETLQKIKDVYSEFMETYTAYLDAIMEKTAEDVLG